MDQSFPIDIAYHIKQEVQFIYSDDFWDIPRWMPTSTGKFTVTSAWKILRHGVPTNHEYNQLWTKGLPFKISVFLWRLCKGKILTDDLWRRWGYMIVSKCRCCSQPHEDSFQNLFLNSETTMKVWKTFLHASGLVVNLTHVHQVIRAWWNTRCCPKLNPLFQAVPAVITWEF